MEMKTAVITGSRRGIGLGIAQKLGKNGYRVVLSDVVEKEEVISLLEEMKNKGYAFDYVKCDISKAADRKNLLSQVKAMRGPVSLLVNNAGVAPLVREDVLHTREESFDRVININLKSTFFMCQLFANDMIEEKKKDEDYQPRIVNISSMSAYTSSTARGEYCISKAGISMVTSLFADMLAEYGVPVFEVRPGIIMTDMTEVVKEKYEKMIREGVTPIKRFGYPEDVANCVYAAASGLLDFSTGQVLNADGGFHIRRL